VGRIWFAVLSLAFGLSSVIHIGASFRDGANFSVLLFIQLALFFVAGFSIYKINFLLSRAQRRVAAQKSRSQKIAQFAHEFISSRVVNLRRPLQGLIGIQDLYAETQNATEAKDYFDITNHCSKYLVRQLDKIQLYSELACTPIEFQSSPFSLEKCISQIIDAAREQTRSETRVIFSISPQLSDNVVGSQVALQRIIIELLDNALRFAGHEPIHLRVVADPENPNCPRFTITDTGPGLPEKFLQLLNAPKHQRHRLLSWAQAKDGLGLILTGKILALTNAHVFVQSTRGVGTQISFSMDPTHLCFAKTEIPKMHNRKKPPKVLVVEDETLSQQILCEFLTRLGIEATVATDGREAIHKCQYDGYDLILMDLHLPHVDGFEASEAILHKLKIPKRPHVIAISAECTQADQIRCREIGIHAFLPKPITQEQLTEAILALGYLLDLPTLNQEPTPEPKEGRFHMRGEYMIDFNRLYNSLNESLELCHQVLENAVVSLETGVQDLSSAMDRGDLKELAKITHKIRGELAIIMCDTGVQAILALEAAARKNDTVMMTQAYEVLCKAIELIAIEVEGLVKNRDMAA
jgi:CheY-like chemotaxis protein/signal transduction histidine kinase